MQFPPGVAILPGCAVYSKRGQSSSWAGGREAEHDRQSGFRMVEPPRATSGSARSRRSLVAENRALFVTENWRRPRIAAPHRPRSPPGRRIAAGSFRRELAERQHRPQIRRWASGCHR